MGDGPQHFCFGEAEAAAEGLAGGGRSGGQRAVPVVVEPQRGVVRRGGVGYQQGEIFQVVGLLAAEALDRPDAGSGLAGIAMEGVDPDGLRRIDAVAFQRVIHAAVEPDVVRFDILAQAEVALLAVEDDVAVFILLLERLAVGVQRARRGPVPEHLGGHAAAGESGDVAGLAGQRAGMGVEAVAPRQAAQ